MTLTDGGFRNNRRREHASRACAVWILSPDPEVVLEALDQVRDGPPGGAGVGVGTDAPPAGLAVHLFYDVPGEWYAAGVHWLVPLQGDRVASDHLGCQIARG